MTFSLSHVVSDHVIVITHAISFSELCPVLLMSTVVLSEGQVMWNQKHFLVLLKIPFLVNE